MRMSGVVAICVVCGMVAGCEQDARSTANKRVDMELVRTINNMGVENAIITQHTLYPYHFEADGEELNELGRRDLEVLARQFAEHPGLLNIRQGQTPADLYKARVAQVTSTLKQAGVDPGRVSVSDAMPGGPGIRSERVVTILEKEAKTSATTTTYSGTITR